MSNYERDGGPAFPNPALADENFHPPFDMSGMTLRDYFIAHAPAEPQPWFEPVMETECPVYKVIPYPKKPDDLTNEEKMELEAVLDWMIADSEVEHPRVIAHLKACREIDKQREDAQAVLRQWNANKERQRYIQWPAAWADAMLEQRKKGGAC